MLGTPGLILATKQENEQEILLPVLMHRNAQRSHAKLLTALADQQLNAPHGQGGW